MNIILGQFIPTGSLIEKLNGIVKIIAVFIYIAAVFICRDFIGFLICTIFLLVVVKLSALPIKLLIKGIKPIIFILLFTIVMNLFFTKDGNVIFSCGFISITDNAVYTTLKISARLILVVMFSSMLTLTTKPMELTMSIEDLLSPLKKIKVPVAEIALMMSIALRFIPTLYEELDRIKKAQQARGAVFDEGNLYKRIKSLIPVIIPLFVSSFKRADELAMAMESRCYSSKAKRTRFHDYKLTAADYISVIFTAIFALIIFVLEYLI